MAIDFPATPTVGQTYTYNGQTWHWNGQYWDSTGDGSGGGCTADSIPPPSPSPGDMWFDTTTGKTYIWYDNTWSEMFASPTVADASTLTGSTLASNVVNSSLTKVGTLGTLQINTPVAPAMEIRGAGSGIRLFDRDGTDDYSSLNRQNDVFHIWESTIGQDVLTLDTTGKLTTKAGIQVGGNISKVGDVAILSDAAITIQSNNKASLQVNGDNAGINPTSAGQLFLSGRVARMLVGSGAAQTISGAGFPANTRGNVFKLGDIPVRNGDVLVIHGCCDVIPTVAGWVIIGFTLYTAGGGLIQHSPDTVVDSNVNTRRTGPISPLVYNVTNTESVQLYLQGNTAGGGTAAAQSVMWDYQVFGTR